ncbi:MAG: T9SS type A sorting domain-containing protein [Bacteroidota bacterium]
MMKIVRSRLFTGSLFLLLSVSALHAQVTTNGGSGLAPTYPSLSDAITALNLATINAPVIINLTAGNPQTATAGGYIINAQGSATNTITITGNNNIITASPALTGGALNDGIFKIIGGDYVTIENFTMTENAANTTTAAGTNNMTEWGVALLYASTTNGSQNNTIKNCTIDLDRSYQNSFGIYCNSNHTATAISTAVPPPTAAGGNSGLTITGNTITDVNVGIVVIGPSPAAAENDGLIIGGSVANANTISNFGNTGTFSSYANVSGTVNGILIRFTKNLTVSYNTITSSNGGTVAGSLRGIYVPAFTNAPVGAITNTISNNSISLKSNVLAGAIQGISVEATTANATTNLNINNNDITGLGHTIAGASGAITGIISASAALNTSISSNTFTNLNVNTTNSFTFLSCNVTMPAGGSQTVSGNSIVTGFTKTGAGGSLILFTTNASSPTGTTSINSNNNFSNITITGATTNGGWVNRDGVSTISGPVKTITNNTFSNWTNGTSIVTVLTENAGSATSVVSGNIISNIATAGTLTGISLLSNSNVTLQGNTVNTLSSTGASVVTGISVTGTSNANNTPRVLKNKVYDLLANNGGGSVSGILIGMLGTVSNADITIANNLIGDLKAPISNLATDAIRGININAYIPAVNSRYNVYYNTIYINAASSGANFGTAGIFHARSATATNGVLELKNNIIINTSTPSGTGTTAAFSRSNAGLENYSATSNNNIFYAGIPSATNAIYYDSTNGSAATIADFKTLVTPRETASATENVAFLSTTGSSSNYLHVKNTLPTVAQNGGIVIATVTDDYDGETRTATPDIGADEFPDVPLPVAITNLKATRQAEAILLTWTTLTEANNNGFEILKSADGVNFSKMVFIASKATNGNSTAGLNYEVTDKTPFTASNYYKLKQSDRDGKIMFSNIVVLRGNKVNQLQLTTIYPNPATDKLNVLIASPKAGNVMLLVTDLSGRVLVKQATQIVNGETNIQLNVSTLASGNYVLKLVGDGAGDATTTRFVKQ